MCSWCWGFRSVFQQLITGLPPAIEIQYVMGGLAPDSDDPMPPETCEYVQSQWRLVEAQTSATFNWDFWEQCQPRRSTYPACRAVIATGLQGKEKIPEMIHAIQNAYYQQARNPSDQQTLIELADEIQIDNEQFMRDLKSTTVDELLQADFQLRTTLNVTGFPSLRLQQDKLIKTIDIDYLDASNMLKQIN